MHARAPEDAGIPAAEVSVPDGTPHVNSPLPRADTERGTQARHCVSRVGASEEGQGHDDRWPDLFATRRKHPSAPTTKVTDPPISEAPLRAAHAGPMGRAFSPSEMIQSGNLGRWPRLVWLRAFGPPGLQMSRPFRLSPQASTEPARPQRGHRWSDDFAFLETTRTGKSALRSSTRLHRTRASPTGTERSAWG